MLEQHLLKEGSISSPEGLPNLVHSPLEKRRKCIWEINSHFFCPVIGTCLSFDEQKRMLKKAKVSYKKFNLYEIHQLMVQNIQTENQLSHRINNYLNLKYREGVMSFSYLDEHDFIAVWKKEMETGDICDLFWVAVTRPDFSEKSLHTVFGDVHMLSLLNAGEMRQELHAANMLRENNRELSEKLKYIKENRRKIKKELNVSQKTVLEMEGRLGIVEGEKKRLKIELENLWSNKYIDELKAINDELQLQLKQVQSEFQESSKNLRFLQKENKKLKLNSSSQREIINQLKSEVESAHYQVTNIDVCDNTCPMFDLCSRRILIVGGMSKLKEFYRDLIEKMGGIFEYHDGNINSGKNVLHSLVDRADIILCPIDCNSHGACLFVKKFCKRQNKPFHMLPSSSISSISRELLSLAKTG